MRAGRGARPVLVTGIVMRARSATRELEVVAYVEGFSTSPVLVVHGDCIGKEPAPEIYVAEFLHYRLYFGDTAGNGG